MTNTWVFKDRAVAFLDILGFTHLMKRAEREPSELKSLFGLPQILDSHVKWDNNRLDADFPDAAKPQYIFISDSLIITMPFSTDRKSGGTYDGLVGVLIKSIEISHKLFEAGFLVRGGISIGPVWQDETNIFGTGYIEAVELEKNANNPRIVLSERASKHWSKISGAGQLYSGFGLCVEEDVAWIADTLNSNYVSNLDRHGRQEEAFDQYFAHINSNLASLPTGTSPR